MDEAQRIANELAEQYKRLGVPPMKNEKGQKAIDKRQARILIESMNNMVTDPNMSVDDMLKAAGLL